MISGNLLTTIWSEFFFKPGKHRNVGEFPKSLHYKNNQGFLFGSSKKTLIC